MGPIQKESPLANPILDCRGSVCQTFVSAGASLVVAKAYLERFAQLRMTNTVAGSIPQNDSIDKLFLSFAEIFQKVSDYSLSCYV